MTDAMFEPQYWECGDEVCDILDADLSPEQRRDAIRKLIDNNVHDAISEYVEAGHFSISFRMGGSPIVAFDIYTQSFDKFAGKHVDLGDLLLALEKSSMNEPMDNLAASLLETYMAWRKQRLTDTDGARIPLPEVDDCGDPVKRPELPTGLAQTVKSEDKL